MEKKTIKIKMEKKLSYSKANKQRGEQYSLGLPIDILKDMGITVDERKVSVFYNTILKELKIKKL